jgi:hypothetical protein
LDHHILVPAKNPGLTFKRNGANTEIRHNKAFFSFPTKDVLLLPMPNTTCECLAAYIGTEFKKSLLKIGAPPVSLVIEVEESPGLSAWCALEEA